MDDKVDHYALLGLPSGEEGAKLSVKDITKAYKKKALELHPDKRPNDSNAHAEIQQLYLSYAILKDEEARKKFDDLLRVQREKVRRNAQHDSKRQKMMSDLDERERAAFGPDPSVKAREEEERIAREFVQELTRIRAEYAKKFANTVASPTPPPRRESTDSGRSDLDKEKVLKVSWDKIGEDYSAERLTELFKKFGEVEDVVIRTSKKKKGSALVVMGSKDAAVAACGSLCGNLSNPLLVLPLQPDKTTFSTRSVEPDAPELGRFVGIGHKEFEDSVLKKLLQKAAEKQK